MQNGWNIIHCAVASGSLKTLQWLLAEKAGVLKTTDLLDAPNMVYSIITIMLLIVFIFSGHCLIERIYSVLTCL